MSPAATGPPTHGSSPRPSSPSDPIDAATSGQTREVLRRLELDVTRRLDGLLHGDHRGLVPGHGSEPGETRRYSPGDDVRRIDWNVTARLSEPHLRESIADRELETWLLVDRSPRLDFGTARCEKRDLALAGAAAVGFLTNRDGNRIGAVLTGLDGAEPEVIPARSGRRHLLRLLHTLNDSPRSTMAGVTDLTAALHRLNGVARRRGLAAIISDFRVQPGWEGALGVTALRHDLLAIEVSDPREDELPNVGLLTVVDPGTGRVRELATNKASVRATYAEAGQRHHDHLVDTFRRHQVDHLRLSTDRPWLDDVVAFVSTRRARLAAGGGARR